MPLGLTEAIAQGSRGVWATFGLLWLVAAAIVLVQRAPARPLGAALLLTVASATGLMALELASALSVPRLVWHTVEQPALLAPRGDTFRKLRGPVVATTVDGLPDLAVPTIDDEGRWVLYALLAARPLWSSSPAPVAAPKPGGPRLCTTGTEPCRAWPASWPSPTQARPIDELAWSKQVGRGVLAYAPETGQFLHDAGPRGEARLELVGSLTAEPSGEAASAGASALFVVSRVAAGHLLAMRVVRAETPTGARFFAQRARISLQLGPRALDLARPLLGLVALALPLGGLAYVLVPAWLAKRRRVELSAARATLVPWLHALAVLAIGAALAVPALVAMASMLAAR
jgi:hypothetical protein